MDFKALWQKHLKYWKDHLIPNNYSFWNNTEPFQGYKIFMLSSAIIHESIELQRETQFRWWKKSKGLDIPHIKEELMDIAHFTFQLAMELGMTPEEFIEEYNKKLNINIKRQEDGY